jgi:hypothetical protein
MALLYLNRTFRACTCLVVDMGVLMGVRWRVGQINAQNPSARFFDQANSFLFADDMAANSFNRASSSHGSNGIAPIGIPAPTFPSNALHGDPA